MLELGPLIHLSGTELDFNPWNPNRMDAWMYTKAVESIDEFGMVDPCLVREKGTRYEMIDGEHRARACIDRGLPIPAHSVGKISDHTAKRLTIALNEIHGQADPAEMGKLLEGLLADTSVEELLKGLPFTDDAIDAFVGASKIEWPEPHAPASPSAGASPNQERWVERTYRLPGAVADVLDQAINRARVAFGDGHDHSDAECLEVIAAEFLAS